MESEINIKRLVNPLKGVKAPHTVFLCIKKRNAGADPMTWFMWSRKDGAKIWLIFAHTVCLWRMEMIMNHQKSPNLVTGTCY